MADVARRGTARRMLCAALAALSIVVASPAPPALGPGIGPWPPAVAVTTDPDAMLERLVDGGRIHAGLLRELRRHGWVEAIAAFRPLPDGGMATAEALAAWKSRALAPLERAGGVVRDYRHLRSSLLRFTSVHQLLAFLADPAVAGIALNRAVRTADAEANRLIRQPGAAAAGYRGQGTAVAVLDTGVDYRRAAFGSCTAPGRPVGCRVVVARDFAPDDARLDDVGHGTAVAGVVAAVAPRTRLLALDVFRADGLAYDSDVLRAIDWLIPRRDIWNVRAVNLSVADGTHWLEECPFSGLQPAFEALRDAGVAVVAASGNAGTVAGAYADGIAYPACVPGALSVGGVYDANVGRVTLDGCTDETTSPDLVACFSQGGSPLDMLAPTAMITTAGEHGWWGTSMAAPHASGAVAVVFSSRPTAALQRVEYVVRGGGPLVTDHRSGQRFRRLDVLAAAQRIRDTRRPSLGDRSPAPNAEGVPTSAVVSGQFSEKVRGVNGDTVVLRDAAGIAVPARVTYAARTRRFRLVPVADLAGGMRYTVSLSSGIRDLGGNRLGRTSWSFTTTSG